MNIKELRKIITNKLEVTIDYREKTRGSGVYLAESIGTYYMIVGEIQTLQSIGELVGVSKKLLDYDPFEKEEDDDQYNYCGYLGGIGRKEVTEKRIGE